MVLSKISEEQKEIYKPKWRKVLYCVEVDDEEGEFGSWDGQINAIKRYTGKSIEKSTKALMTRIDKLQEE